MDAANNFDNLKRGAVQTIVGGNYQYYIDNWFVESWSSPRILENWNWAAFALDGLWFSYRKMYLLGLIFPFIQSGILFCTFLTGRTRTLLSLALFIFILKLIAGFLGNSVYKRKVMKCLRRSEILNDIERTTYIKKAGGVSVSAPIFTVLAVLAFFGICLLLLALALTPGS